jgi:hypothetical protein
MTGRADRWIRRTTIGCVTILALIAGTVSYLHMHALGDELGKRCASLQTDHCRAAPGTGSP